MKKKLQRTNQEPYFLEILAINFNNRDNKEPKFDF